MGPCRVEIFALGRVFAYPAKGKITFFLVDTDPSGVGPIEAIFFEGLIRF